MTKIVISAIPSELCGDWHDKPLRWAVAGPANGEIQKFSTREDARRYRKLRLQYDARTAGNLFARS